MKWNWKAIVGLLLIFLALREIIPIIMDYRSGAITFWPWGVETGALIMIIGGALLFIKSQKQKKHF